MRSRFVTHTGALIRAFCGIFGLVALLLMQGCSHVEHFRDPNMDFGSIQSVAVMPFGNLSKDTQAAERVRDVFNTKLLATGALYVIPVGEVSRVTGVAGVMNPTAPTPEEVVKLAKMIKADAVITGMVREYGDVRSGSSMADVISLSLQVMEAQTGRVVWSASATEGGIGFTDRLLGGGGRPLNDVTEKAVDDLISKLFQ
ncbi:MULTISPECIES: GNA1162 family protein [Geobacter]|uniref:Lipoprotein n=2 Tax=Geobacter TaxID=28231 RepID=A0A0C1TQS8_9BACT|nr:MULTISPECIES: GNA1162 family protein [Geobacter]KIE41638.1 hypothetical protein SE37_02850 [Geobacter soli]MBE2887453.1 DUF799 family lipoprotein [Geobacter anodireducens]HMN03026.1 DUF799 family lipoprotein [Geobacter anodireducens]